MKQSELDLLKNYIAAATTSLNRPLSENNTAVEALWNKITNLDIQNTPINWNEMNDVADWVVALQSSNQNIPTTFIQLASEAGKTYLNEPTKSNKERFDISKNIVQIAERRAIILGGEGKFADIPVVLKRQFIRACDVFLENPTDKDKQAVEELWNKLAAPEAQLFNRTYSVFIANDNLDFIKLLRLMLERQNFSVQAASSGKEIFTSFQQQEHMPDIMLLDLIMPGMGGFEVLEKLHAEYQHVQFPVILMSFPQPFTELPSEEFLSKKYSRVVIPLEVRSSNPPNYPKVIRDALEKLKSR